MRHKFPDCLIVAGGPDPDYKNTDLFGQHPYLDAVVVQDGKVPFRQILEQLAHHDLALERISGMVLPPSQEEIASGATYHHTGPA